MTRPNSSKKKAAKIKDFYALGIGLLIVTFEISKLTASAAYRFYALDVGLLIVTLATRVDEFAGL